MTRGRLFHLVALPPYPGARPGADQASGPALVVSQSLGRDHGQDGRATTTLPAPGGLPDQLESELNLPRRCGCAGDDTGSGGGDPSGRCEYDQVWGIEISAIQGVEKLRPKLEIQFLRNLRVFEQREIKRSEPRANNVGAHVKT